MNKFKTVLLACLFFCSPFSLACDDLCKKEAAEKKYNVNFSGYLTLKYCDDLVGEFMSTDINNIQNYSSKHFNTKYKGPVKNMIKFLEQRKAWLMECEVYTSLTYERPLFIKKETNDKIFAQMNSIIDELKAVVAGSTYSSDTGDGTVEVVQGKFESLYKIVDIHKSRQNLLGRYVYQ